MTKIMFALAAAFALAGTAYAKDAKATLKVSGWHCAGCSAKTESALKKIDGVKAVATDLDKNQATIDYDDSKVQVAQLEKAVTDAGFKVAK